MPCNIKAHFALARLPHNIPVASVTEKLRTRYRSANVPFRFQFTLQRHDATQQVLLHATISTCPDGPDPRTFPITSPRGLKSWRQAQNVPVTSPQACQ